MWTVTPDPHGPDRPDRTCSRSHRVSTSHRIGGVTRRTTRDDGPPRTTRSTSIRTRYSKPYFRRRASSGALCAPGSSTTVATPSATVVPSAESATRPSRSQGRSRTRASRRSRVTFRCARRWSPRARHRRGPPRPASPPPRRNAGRSTGTRSARRRERAGPWERSWSDGTQTPWCDQVHVLIGRTSGDSGTPHGGRTRDAPAAAHRRNTHGPTPILSTPPRARPG